ncbi:hypothetical protein [Stenotrophomonas sp. SbOxS2]|uniref:hypothetical protein n=1 Tax=Stenotrophomonas sp. SbOxS2 TaxID=2723885 RepID=UPI00211EC9B4|nr:hypothetical protein [Stenotrophomonas sp. SbOxS2]
MASGDGLDAMGEHQIGRCGCKTEQGTSYVMDQEQCRLVAREGQYEPFLDTNKADARRMNDLQQSAHYQQEARYEREAVSGSTISKQVRALGSFPESPVYTSSTSVTPPTTRDM